jgi:hypothetical protein
MAETSIYVVRLESRRFTVTCCIAGCVTRLGAILGDKMADPVGLIRFVPGRPGKWYSKRIIGIWFHISLKTIDGAVRISAEATKSGTWDCY